MTAKHRLNVYGRKHIHDHVRLLAEWKKTKRDPNHTISEEYDTLLIAGIKATYGQDIPLNVAPAAGDTPPAPAVAAHE